MIFLTDAERERFACWLEHEAASNDEILRQLTGALERDSASAGAVMVKKLRTEAMAANIILAKLKLTHTETL